MKSLILLAVALLLSAGHVAAQDFNVDIYDHFGTPDPAYPAAGQPGSWQMVPPVDPGTPVPLSDISGAPTVAAVSFPFFGQSAGWIGTGPATGNDEALLEDGFWAIDIIERCQITGLVDGPYELITYGIVTDHPGWSTFFIVGDFDGVCGGAWTGVFVEGVTHLTFMVEVTGGNLNIDYASGFFGGAGMFSGFQLDYQGVVSETSNTWGGIKSLYR